MTNRDKKDPLLSLWQAGVNAVRGANAVQSAMDTLSLAPPDRLIAVGKAACDMARPILETHPHCPAVIVTKHGHGEHLSEHATILEAGHPVPDAGSLQAGQTLMDFVAAAPSGAHLICLISGGASAVAECLPSDMSLEAWQAQTQDLLASGADIHEINRFRKSVSKIKAGKLLAKFSGARVTTLAISDVEGDSLDVIGSGLGTAPPSAGFEVSTHIIASNARARAQAAEASYAPVVVNEESLYDDVTTLAPRLAKRIQNAPSGILIFGGEPTVVLPANPGRGGRNQALALHMAREISGQEGIRILVAGTDGTDGPTPDAGALVDGTTWGPGAAEALQRADAGTYLAGKDALLTTGPTGTNVMDLMIVHKA